MDAMRETTGVVGEFRYPEHIYFVEKDKVFGYIREGESELTLFKKPMRFSTRFRKFVKKKNVKIEDFLD